MANYTTTLYNNSPAWIAAISAAAAGKVIAAGVYKEGSQNVFWVIIAS